MFHFSCKTLILLSALFIIPNAACAQPANPAADPSQQANNPPAAKPLAASDQSFLNDAAQAGMAETEGAMLARQKAATAEVRHFAAQMITEHAKVNDELTSLAATKGVELPTEPSLLQKGELKALALLDDKFDENYVDRLGVAAHERAIALFQDTAVNSQDRDIKAFVERTLPSLQTHLKLAKALNPTVSKARPQP
ncbi:MAG TPA: DUF4142 domain-containing protein [Advenella sp.]|nr:DUF4142 domain-containing protein [Advenella sp.]